MTNFKLQIELWSNGTIINISLIFTLVNSVWSLESVQSGVDEVSTVECSSERFGSWVVFIWQVLLLWDFRAVLLVRGHVQQILFQCLFWVLDFFGLSWEVSWDNILLLYLCHIILDSSVDLCIELSIFSHFFQSLVFVGFHRVV